MFEGEGAAVPVAGSQVGSPAWSADGWAVPGVPLPRPEQGPADDVVALTAAVEQALAVEPDGLLVADAVARAEALLALQDRLAVAALTAVADVDARDGWRARQSGSTRTWLRTLPCGDRGQLAQARALAARPLLRRAAADGTVSVRTATTVGRLLERVPGHVEPGQLQAVLVDGGADLLSVWTGAACLAPTPAQEAAFTGRRQQLAQAVQAGLHDSWSGPAERLEPLCVLAAQVLPPAEVEAGLGLLVDALQPEPAQDAADEAGYRSRSLVLRPLKGGGWTLRAHLTDETGQLLHQELTARLTRHPLDPEPEQPGDLSAALDDVFGVQEAEDTGDDGGGDDGDLGPALDRDSALHPHHDLGPDPDPDDLALHGTAGPGRPPDPADPHTQGTPLPSANQRQHDALTRLLHDLAGVPPGSGTPAPARLTLTAPLAALDGLPGAPPGLLATGPHDTPLAGSRLREHACRSTLHAVLLDAAARPVGASGTHRHATARERRALTAAWGSRCAVNGCTLPGEVPHHVVPFTRSRQTVLADLAPLCPHHHHDLHTGHKTLRLRDGRLLDETGWTDGTWS